MNLLSSIPASLPDELTDTLVKAASVRIERIVSHGHVSPLDFWYDQEENEFVLLVQGSARLRFEDSVLEMMPGAWLNIPAHRKHRVEWTSPDERTVWLAVFFRDKTGVDLTAIPIRTELPSRTESNLR